MADAFISDDFLLETPTGVRLFHDYAKDLPIIDYHCHLPPKQVADDHRFANLAQIWLYGDHYKWRAMRSAGVAEPYCTGAASDREKFQKWAETVPKTLRNPLYHWTHLELKRPFGISDRVLNPETAESIWSDCNAKLAQPEFSCRGIMRQMKVVLVCTTDDPIDSLDDHRRIAADNSFPVRVLPTFRADKALAVDQPAVFQPWLAQLEAVTGTKVDRYARLAEALRARHDFFHAQGCRVSDHGLDTLFAESYTEAELDTILSAARDGKPVAPADVLKFRSAVLYDLAVMDHGRGWVQQFHIGALRNNNSRKLREIGPDTGFDSIGDWPVAAPMSRFFDRLDRDNRLAKTILYNLNPMYNEVFGTMLGNFQDGVTAGKMQFGSGWWFLDQKDGMERQIETLSNLGLLSQFVGMLTDSRSFLSYTRHEYFRRILCNILGRDVDRGLLPRDVGLLGQMVVDICYRNAAKYFDFGLPTEP